MPSGCRPRREASPSSISTQAEAPSESWEALPAVMKRPCFTRWPSVSTGLSAAKPSERRVGPVALVLGERDLLVGDLAGRLVLHRHARGHRHDLGVEAAGLLRRGGALLASAARTRPAPRARRRSGRPRSRRSPASSCRAAARAPPARGRACGGGSSCRSAPARSTPARRPPRPACRRPSPAWPRWRWPSGRRSTAGRRSCPARVSGRPARSAHCRAMLEPWAALLQRRAHDHVLDLRRVEAGALHRLRRWRGRRAPGPGCR